MRRIIINDFGPLGHVDLWLNQNLNLVIGSQASGKSTLSKAIYFCRKIRDYLTNYVAGELIPKGEGDLRGFQLYLRRFFMGCFGTTRHMTENFSIQYSYDENSAWEKEMRRRNIRWVSISLKEGFVMFSFSDSLRRDIDRLLKDIKTLKDTTAQRQRFSASIQGDFLDQTLILATVKRKVREIFRDDSEFLYIPAGRNLLTVTQEQLMPELGVMQMPGSVDIHQTEMITQEFIAHIRYIRSEFGSGLGEIVENYKQKRMAGEQIPEGDLKQAVRLIQKILNGEYIWTREEERIYYNPKNHNQWVRLMFASSGQQEALWMLNSLFLRILHREKTFVIVEEPESHLYPETQLWIAQLIALLIQSNGSEVFLTTHSPYVLTAFNLLIYSGQVEGQSNGILNGLPSEEKADGKEQSVIPRPFRIKPGTVGAWQFVRGRLGRHGLKSILSDGLIQAEEIDHISDEIIERTDRLMDMELRMEASSGEKSSGEEEP